VLTAYEVLSVAFLFHVAPAAARWTIVRACALYGVGAEFRGACWTAGGVLRAYEVLSIVFLFHVARVAAFSRRMGFCSPSPRCVRGNDEAGVAALSPALCRDIRSTHCAPNRLARNSVEVSEFIGETAIQPYYSIANAAPIAA